MSKSYISQEERIERLNAVRHEIAQHFNEGFAWIDQILSEEIEQIGLEENLGKWIFEKGDDKTCVDGYICSACGRSFHTKVPYFSEYKFCPECGTRMEEVIFYDE